MNNMLGRWVSAAFGMGFGCASTGALVAAYFHWDTGMLLNIIGALVFLIFTCFEAILGED